MSEYKQTQDTEATENEDRGVLEYFAEVSHITISFRYVDLTTSLSKPRKG